MNINTNDFKPITGSVVGMGVERIEYEELLAWMLNKLIQDNLPLESPIKLKFDHCKMVQKGYLEYNGGGYYSLTLKSISILKEFQDKQIKQH